MTRQQRKAWNRANWQRGGGGSSATRPSPKIETKDIEDGFNDSEDYYIGYYNGEVTAVADEHFVTWKKMPYSVFLQAKQLAENDPKFNVDKFFKRQGYRQISNYFGE